jgi:hypothetical protein
MSVVLPLPAFEFRRIIFKTIPMTMHVVGLFISLLIVNWTKLFFKIYVKKLKFDEFEFFKNFKNQKNPSKLNKSIFLFLT